MKLNPSARHATLQPGLTTSKTVVGEGGGDSCLIVDC